MVLESSTRLQSNFTVDMTQVSFSLRQATSRSLLLLDETATATNTAGLCLAPTSTPEAFG